MSLSTVHATLSGLKSCQEDLGAGMDIVTVVALDLAEAQDKDVNPAIKELEVMLLDCAKLDREINYFVDVVKRVTEEANSQEPEAMFSLSAKVKEQFEQKIAGLSDAALQSHSKVKAFRENINSEGNKKSAENMEELDEDLTVTQTQVNLICPLTQLEMVKPMKNEKCNHHYDADAIRSLIKRKQSQKKKCRCPVVGCENTDVKESDLVPDQMLLRRILSQKREANRM